MLGKRSTALVSTALVYVVFMSAEIVAAPTVSEGEMVVGEHAQADDHFGLSVAISGDTMVVADDHAVNVLVRDGSGWRQQSRLLLQDGGEVARPGKVAISGNTIAVGAPGAGDDGGCSPSGDRSEGRVYVFERRGDQWFQQAVLPPITRCNRGPARFGRSVSISGDTIIAGAVTVYTLAHGPTGDAGVFVRQGATWTLQQVLTCGGQVDLDGDTAVVAEPGSIGDRINPGRVCVYRRVGSVWSEQAEILPPQNGSYGVSFGTEVFLAGDTLAIRDESVSDEARIYSRESGQWIERAVLPGRPLALSDDLLAIHGGATPQIHTRVDGTWQARVSLVAEFGGPLVSASLDYGNLVFGVPSNDSLAADAGAVFVFDPWGFSDVLPIQWAASFIQALSVGAFTVGCGGGNFCPEDPTTRAQMAVFLERGINGSDFRPPAATGKVFLDVGAGDFAAAFIEQLASDGITAGCGNNNYCPNANVTRAQIAVFLLRAKYGPGYSPPAATGIFGDVDLSYWAAAWIEQLAAEGITAGCGNGNYCPDDPVTRAQMAVFVVRTFEL